MKLWKLTTALVGITSLSVACTNAESGDTAAEDYPSQPISLIVPYSPGGSTDTIARLVGQHMEQNLGQPVTVENVPAGNGVIGVQDVFNAQPDGYTLVMASGSVQTVIPETTDIGFDPLEMTYIGSTHESVAARFVSSKSPWQNIDDLVKSAQSGQELVDVTSGGVGVNDIATAALSEETGGWEWRTLATEGGSEAILRILSGDGDMNQNSATAALPYLESGKVRALLVESPTWPALERMGVPTSEELYGYSIINPSAVLGPPDLPEEIRQVLEEALRAATEDPAVLKKLEATGELITFRTGQEAKDYVEEAAAFNRQIIGKLEAEQGS